MSTDYNGLKLKISNKMWGFSKTSLNLEKKNHPQLLEDSWVKEEATYHSHHS